MRSVEVGDIYETRTGHRFKVLCIAKGDCFVEWNDGYHGVMMARSILAECRFIRKD